MRRATPFVTGDPLFPTPRARVMYRRYDLRRVTQRLNKVVDELGRVEQPGVPPALSADPKVRAIVQLASAVALVTDYIRAKERGDV